MWIRRSDIIKTDVTILSNSINKDLVNNYLDYTIIDNNFNKERLVELKKVIFFNILNNLDEEEVKDLFRFLKSNDVSFINITNNSELAMFTSYLIVYDNNNILIEGNTIDVLQNEKSLKKAGISLPFMVELSLLLKDYGLIDKVFLSKESLVNYLWK